MQKHISALDQNGYVIIPDVFNREACNRISELIKEAGTDKSTFRKTTDLFAIRQLLKEVPEVQHYIFNTRLKQLIHDILGTGFFCTKSIYFDKPAQSNWFVAYHQDLTISVDKKPDLPGFGPWSIKQDQFAVQPPLYILESNFTVRIHLDDTDEHNGALKVIPGSHRKGICRPETIDRATETEHSCNVPKGGIMIMKPLLLHASGRSTRNAGRRVIHLEFGNQQLPPGLNWSEYLDFG